MNRSPARLACLLLPLLVACGARPTATPTLPDGPVVAAGERPGQNGCIDCLLRGCFDGAGALTAVQLETQLDTATQALTLKTADLASQPDPNTAEVVLNLNPAGLGQGPLSLAVADFAHLPKESFWANAEANLTVSVTDGMAPPTDVKWVLTVKQGGCP